VTHGVRVTQRPLSAALWLYALPALALIEAARWIAWHTQSIEDKRTMWVRHVLPERSELAGWTALAVLAGVTEEIAYRAVLFAILYRMTGSLVVAAAATAVSFGFVHAPQGAASQVTIGIIGLVLQALVLVTGSLLPAMLVHAAANVIAGIRGPARFRQLDDLTPSSTAT
jgi:membrane protease YdiL (CAAX protease family)